MRLVIIILLFIVIWVSFQDKIKIVNIFKETKWILALVKLKPNLISNMYDTKFEKKMENKIQGFKEMIHSPSSPDS